ncbi:restriction endonuclease type II-like protein [Lactarius psammicola]|nr:restriction endonuclease type II-like protein [Lactarius psammicola]
MASSVNRPKGKERQPPVVQPGSGSSIIINPCQRLNPIIECIRNVPKEFGDISPDYQVGRTTGVLFLSLRYHRLHPEYIHQRIERLGQAYNLRILLLMCDISEHQDPIRELTKVCLLNNITVIVTWSADEAGQYLTTYKQSEHRAPTLIRERVDKTPDALLRTALTSIPRVNKTDVETLRASFGSFAKIAQADAAQLARLPGFGPKKVARLKDAFDRPFRTGTAGDALPVPGDGPSVSTSVSTPATAAPALPSSSRGGGESGGRTREDAVWDIELDLNSPSPEPAPAKRAREERESPPWDIEIDEGAPLPSGDEIEISSDDTDADIAPALRAKRRRA